MLFLFCSPLLVSPVPNMFQANASVPDHHYSKLLRHICVE